MATLEFTFPHTAPRVYAINTEPSPAFVRFIEEHGRELLRRSHPDGTPAETDDEWTARIWHWFTDNGDRFNGIMRMALAGDHTGIDWYSVGSVMGCLEAIVTYLTTVTPKAAKLRAQIDTRRAEVDGAQREREAAARAEAEERMAALRVGTPMATCGMCGKPVKQWAYSPTGVAVGHDCGCAGKLGLDPPVATA